MKRPDIGAIEARAGAATAGPWTTGKSDPHWRRDVRTELGRGLAFCGAFPEHQAHADAAFIAHAREDVPALLAEVRALREIERLVRRRCAEAVPGWALDLRGALAALDGESGGAR